MEKKCEPLKEVGSANFRAARLVKDKTKELFAVKYIKRQSKVDERAVLKHFDWPEKKADTLREAAFAYRNLKKLEHEI
ncbi:putative protein CHUP1 [Helianthus annuus]|nr:putative protein CHUP1 [Helianthus annuus]